MAETTQRWRHSYNEDLDTCRAESWDPEARCTASNPERLLHWMEAYEPWSKLLG